MADSNGDSRGEADSGSAMNDKMRARLARLAKWKKKMNEQQESTPDAPQKTDQATTGTPKGPIKKTRLRFDDDENDGPSKKKLKPLPTFDDFEEEDGDNNTGAPENRDGIDKLDPLDAYMDDIKEENGTSAFEGEYSEVLMDEEDDIEETHENDEEGLDQALAALEKKKKKDLPAVNHEKIDYPEFRRKFYVEPEEIKELSDKEVDMIRLELDGIKVRGVDCPKPVLRWGQFGISAGAMSVIDNMGYEKPTSIQSQAIPAIMSGRDVIGVAKTGSGKTMAFLLPMFRHIMDQPRVKPGEGPIALIMAPTRELAVQIHRECKRFVKELKLKAACVYGGASLGEHIADMKRGAEIVVCTPGRMIDLLVANSGRVTNLRRVTYLVLDEADRMFDMGFEPQVTKIVRNTRPDRQTVLFSATFPRPMEALAKKILVKPVEIVVGVRSMVAPEVLQQVELCETPDKFGRLLEILGNFFNRDDYDEVRSLVFVDRQETADELMILLKKLGYSAMSTHAGKEQVDRDQAISDFKKGDVNVLVATSVAARGLDVKQCKLVVNYDAPTHLEDYVHRVGRTGRAKTNGTAYTFLTSKEERQAADVVKAMKASNTAIPPEVQKMADQFMERVKAGKERYSRSGYRGKGLDKLDEAREKSRAALPKDQDGADGGENGEDGEDSKGGGKEGTSASDDKILAKYDVGPEAVIIPGKFYERKKGRGNPPQPDPNDPECHAIFPINDFPKQARVYVNNKESQEKITDEYSVSFTGKGRFYPPGQTPGEDDEPKLYILIEGQSAESVYRAYAALKQHAIAGIKSESKMADRSTGRYNVL